MCDHVLPPCLWIVMGMTQFLCNSLISCSSVLSCAFSASSRAFLRVRCSCCALCLWRYRLAASRFRSVTSSAFDASTLALYTFLVAGCRAIKVRASSEPFNGSICAGKIAEPPALVVRNFKSESLICSLIDAGWGGCAAIAVMMCGFG